jgi:predicted transcriptional regulator
MNNRKNLVKVVDMLGLLVRAPRTIPELTELTGMHRHTLNSWLELLCEEGLVRKEARIRRNPNGKVFKYYWSPPTCTPQD